YYHDKKYPIDIQSASQAIDTLTHLGEIDPASFVLARKVAEWTIDNMQDDEGYFYYRDLGWKKVKVPMIHWGQSTMFKAMVCLFGKITEPPMTRANFTTSPADKTLNLESNMSLLNENATSSANSESSSHDHAVKISTDVTASRSLSYVLVTAARNEEA